MLVSCSEDWLRELALELVRGDGPPQTKATPPARNLSDLLLHSPFAGANLDLGRAKDYPRSVDLG